jgi:hypothetical protein
MKKSAIEAKRLFSVVLPPKLQRGVQRQIARHGRTVYYFRSGEWFIYAKEIQDWIAADEVARRRAAACAPQSRRPRGVAQGARDGL